MKSKFNLPQYKTANFYFNNETRYFTTTETDGLESPVNRLTNELRIAPTKAENIKCHAKELIVSRERFKSGSYRFITGIQPTSYKDWLLGNDYESINGQKVISLILFKFNKNRTQLTVYYFPRYDKARTDLRLLFANEVIPHLLKPELV